MSAGPLHPWADDEAFLLPGLDGLSAIAASDIGHGLVGWQPVEDAEEG